MISVIIPVFNVAPYIEKCLDSIISQTYKDIEILLIDDGSTDLSGQICEAFAEKDKRIKVFHINNQGVSIARNIGLSESKGEYISFIDSDDYIGKDYLQNLHTIITTENVDLVVGGEVKDYGSNLFTFRFIQGLVSNNSYSTLFSKHKLHKHSSPWGKLFKKTIIEKYSIRFNESVHLGEDIIFVFDYLAYCSTVFLTNVSEYYYTQREGSLTKKINNFDSEFEGIKAFDTVSDKIILQHNLNAEAVSEIRQWSVIFYDRTKVSILRGQKDKQLQRKRFSMVNWDRLKEFKQYHSRIDKLLDSLLWNKHYALFSFSHRLRNLI